MIIKLLIFLALGITIYRFLGGKVPFLDSKPKQTKDKDLDTLDSCTSCGVYTLKKDGIVKNGSFYCSTDCLNK